MHLVVAAVRLPDGRPAIEVRIRAEADGAPDDVVGSVGWLRPAGEPPGPRDRAFSVRRAMRARSGDGSPAVVGTHPADGYGWTSDGMILLPDRPPPPPFFVLADDLEDGRWLVEVTGRTAEVEIRRGSGGVG